VETAARDTVVPVKADFADRIGGWGLARRRFLVLTGIGILSIPRLIDEALAMESEPPSLLTVPLELGGGWNASPTDAVLRVLMRMREVSLAGVKLLSDRQPAKIHVEDHPTGSPAIWLHSVDDKVASIIVNIGTDDWEKLSYQFGHELGHVLCNSWDFHSQPHTPCQWVEESMVESFSIRGLGRLAASWESNPPFAGNAAFGASIREYRQNLIKKYGEVSKTDAEIASWFRASRGELERSALSGIESPLILRVVSKIESDIGCVEDLGALNRWPSPHAEFPLEGYLTLWEKSCAEIHSPGRLPPWLRSILGVS
jgi:hypothetical protein